MATQFKRLNVPIFVKITVWLTIDDVLPFFISLLFWKRSTSSLFPIAGHLLVKNNKWRYFKSRSNIRPVATLYLLVKHCYTLYTTRYSTHAVILDTWTLYEIVSRSNVASKLSYFLTYSGRRASVIFPYFPY